MRIKRGLAAGIGLASLLVPVACDSGGAGGAPSPNRSATVASPSTAEPGSCRGPAAGEVAFETSSGLCVPISSLVMLRCAGADTLLVRGGGTGRERRFLGGAFAVPMGSLPADAKLIGIDRGLRVLGVPGDPRLLYVKRRDEVERWLSLPRRPVPSPAAIPASPEPSGSSTSSVVAPAAGSAPIVSFIGDSIAKGAAPALQSSLPGWITSFDAVVGRSSASGVAIAAAQAIAVPPPDVVVVELGTNDGAPIAFRANVNAILDSLQGVPLVVWQTTHGPMSRIPAINVQIRRAVRRSPNAAIADWDTYVPDEDLSSDGVHPLPTHEDDMAKLIAPLLAEWVKDASTPVLASCSGMPDAGAP